MVFLMVAWKVVLMARYSVDWTESLMVECKVVMKVQ